MIERPIKSGGTVPRSAAEAVMGSRIFWPPVQANLENIGQLIHFGNSTTDANLPKTAKAAERGLIESSGCDGITVGQSQRFLGHPNAIEIPIVDNVVLLRCADGTGDPRQLALR